MCYVIVVAISVGEGYTNCLACENAASYFHDSLNNKASEKINAVIEFSHHKFLAVSIQAAHKF